MPGVTIRSRDLERLGRDLRRSGQKDLQKEAMQRMRTSVRPIVPKVRQKVRQSPAGTGNQRSQKSVGERPRGLRDAIARGVQLKVSLSGKHAGVRLRVDPRHFPDGQKHLPKYREGVLKRWRSPTFGHDPWKVQRPEPYFFPVIRAEAPRVRADVLDIVNDITSRITGD